MRTYKEAIEYVKQQAGRFARHEYQIINHANETLVIHGHEPGKGNIFSFTVVIRPSMIMMYGDIGSLVLHPYGNQTCRETYDWLNNCERDLDYVAGKIPHKMKGIYREFDPDDAVLSIKEYAKSVGEYDEAMAQKMLEELEYTEQTKEHLYDMLYRVTEDHDFPDLMSWNVQFLTQIAALSDMRQKITEIP